ncbi:MAG TPA: His/Gly/Thr/Pro-type tRNA ligase C-terminal domain-containing protein [Holophagaceae bacterium]|nr:His/Gly/Thr/Pro-type tRNA ligase C-terminal domain-containing protein [Holophagaceae bacterium]
MPLGPAAAMEAMKLVQQWWAAGLAVQLDTRGLALKKVLASADRLGIRTVLLLGDGELAEGVVTAKHLATGEQEKWPLAEVPAQLRGL